MKIDKTNPLHLLALTLFGCYVLIAIPLRLLRRTNKNKTVILYGHKLSGNLLALHQYWKSNLFENLNMVYLTMDKEYHRELENNGITSVLATNPVSCISLLVQADAIISSHGLHVIAWMVGRSSLKFFDVWHGIPFKGFDADDFRLQQKFDETWVSSPLLAEIYENRFGFSAECIKITGYARTDQLVCPYKDKLAVRKQFELPPTGKIILFAPTWQQDDTGRSIYPFSTPEEEFLDTLQELATRTNSTFIIRAHLNSHEASGASRPNILYRPFEKYPDTEALLLACDVLVCDWSSIAFDWLLLKRPTIFLDVPAPFSKGFSLGPEYRFGPVVTELSTLKHHLLVSLNTPDVYWRAQKVQHQTIYQQVYGPMADGQASRRCMERLLKKIASCP